MTSEKRVTSSLSTTPVDYSESYYDQYSAEAEGAYEWDTPEWQGFFMSVADRIAALLDPRTSLDVGCAKGLLVQALASRGIDARGRDISEYAVQSAHPDVRDRLSVASATDPIDARYDLITCVEVLEHLSAEDAQAAIDAMCAATDRILFSSTPADFDEPTHINVHPTAQWAAWFAERGFFRRTDVDVTFLATWAILFERADLTKRAIVERYERQYAPLNLEVLEKRKALLELDRRVAADREVDEAARQRVVELEATVAGLEGDLSAAKSRIRRLRRRLTLAEEESAALKDSRTWRVGRIFTAPLGRLRR